MAIAATALTYFVNMMSKLLVEKTDGAGFVPLFLQELQIIANQFDVHVLLPVIIKINYLIRTGAILSQ